MSGLYDVSSPKVIRFVARVAGKDRACKLLTRAANLHSTRSGKKIVEGRLRPIEPNRRQIYESRNEGVRLPPRKRSAELDSRTWYTGRAER